MNLPKRKRKKKATSTFLKDPLESAIVHIGKFFDRATSNQLIDLALYAGLAYVGCDTFGWKPESALVGPVSLRMAQSGNLAAGAAGVLGLGTIGVARVLPDVLEGVQDWVDSLGADGEALVQNEMRMSRGLEPHQYEIYTTVTALEGCPSTGQPGEHISVNWGMGLLAKACVRIYPPEPPVDGGNGGVEPPPPPPPPPQWSYHTEGGMVCATCSVCGTTECANNPDTLQYFINLHSHSSNGGGIE